MSEFSDMLKQLCDERNITIKKLADECEIDRTFLHKIIKGERKPPNEDFVYDVCREMRLAENEKENLITNYNLLLMGKTAYKRRKKVSEIIHKLSNKKFETNKSIGFRTEIDLDTIPQITTFNNQKEFLKNIQAILSFEIQNGSKLDIFSKPTDTLNSILSYCSISSEDCIINHLLCLDNSENKQDDLNYNLDIFSYICDFAIEHQNYKPYYFYDNVISYTKDKIILPYFIVSSNFVICYGKNYSNGVIYKSQSLVNFYETLFENNIKKSIEMIEVTNDITDMVKNYYINQSFTVNYDYQPCVICAADEQIFDKLAVIPDEISSWLSQMVMAEKKYFFNKSTYNLFSEEGLAYFMKTGTLVEVPDTMYIKPDLEERKNILKTIIEYAQNDICKYRIITDEYHKSSPNLCVNIINNKILKIITRKNEATNFSYININEKSIIDAFIDYFVFLCGSKYICTKEETIEIMRKYL